MTHAPDLPPEWQTRSSARPTRAVAWVPAERHEWVRAALAEDVSVVEFVDSLTEAVVADADVAIVSHDLMQAAAQHERATFLSGGGAQPEPIRVVIDTPRDARVCYQRDGAEIAVAPEASVREVGAQIGAILRRARMERDRNTLTGLPGNRALRRRLAMELEEKRTVALVMADIDEFKAFNDTHGHLAGDAFICALASALHEAAQAHDAFLAHVGGDDFAMVCRPHEAEEIARIARMRFAQRRAQLVGATSSEVTIVSTPVSPEDAGRLQNTFRRLARLRHEARRGRGKRENEEGGAGSAGPTLRPTNCGE